MFLEKKDLLNKVCIILLTKVLIFHHCVSVFPRPDVLTSVGCQDLPGCSLYCNFVASSFCQKVFTFSERSCTLTMYFIEYS